MNYSSETMAKLAVMAGFGLIAGASFGVFIANFVYGKESLTVVLDPLTIICSLAGAIALSVLAKFTVL